MKHITVKDDKKMKAISTYSVEYSSWFMNSPFVPRLL